VTRSIDETAPISCFLIRPTANFHSELAFSAERFKYRRGSAMFRWESSKWEDKFRCDIEIQKRPDLQQSRDNISLRSDSPNRFFHLTVSGQEQFEQRNDVDLRWIWNNCLVLSDQLKQRCYRAGKLYDQIGHQEFSNHCSLKILCSTLHILRNSGSILLANQIIVLSGHKSFIGRRFELRDHNFKINRNKVAVMQPIPIIVLSGNISLINRKFEAISSSFQRNQPSSPFCKQFP
jgi:hypothetical protein